MLKKIKKYIKKIIYERTTFYSNYDVDFWGNVYLDDIEEVQDNVRYCFGLYEPIN